MKNRLSASVVAASAFLALALRLSRLSRPGYLSGFTQYDGEYFGNAVRLVHGAIAYRDFAMVQPPGGTKPGHGTLPGQERDRREPNMRGLELTGRPEAVR